MFTIHFDVLISRDRVRITNGRTGQTIDRQSSRPFSTQGRLIADKKEAFRFFRQAIVESDGRSRFFRLWADARIKIEFGSVTEADHDDVEQLFIELGCSKVRFL